MLTDDKRTGIRQDLLSRDDRYVCTFGQVAIELGYISKAQLVYALHRQELDFNDGKRHRLLGTILFEMGWIEADNIEKVVGICMDRLDVRDVGCTVSRC
jgi:hypothetical protein